MPVMADPLVPSTIFLVTSSEAETLEEIRVNRQASEVGHGPGCGLSGLVRRINGHGSATWSWGREGGEVEVGRVEEEKVVQVGKAEGGVGMGPAVVGPTQLWGLRHL